MESTSHKFGDLTAEAQAARLLHRRELGFTSIGLLAAEMGLSVERAALLMCRGLSTLLARGYPTEHLCNTCRVTPKQLSRAATVVTVPSQGWMSHMRPTRNGPALPMIPPAIV